MFLSDKCERKKLRSLADDYQGNKLFLYDNWVSSEATIYVKYKIILKMFNQFFLNMP